MKFGSHFKMIVNEFFTNTAAEKRITAYAEVFLGDQGFN